MVGCHHRPFALVEVQRFRQGRLERRLAGQFAPRSLPLRVGVVRCLRRLGTWKVLVVLFLLRVPLRMGRELVVVHLVECVLLSLFLSRHSLLLSLTFSFLSSRALFRMDRRSPRRLPHLHPAYLLGLRHHLFPHRHLDSRCYHDFRCPHHPVYRQCRHNHSRRFLFHQEGYDYYLEGRQDDHYEGGV
jgi:hypothetical protein